MSEYRIPKFVRNPNSLPFGFLRSLDFGCLVFRHSLYVHTFQFEFAVIKNKILNLTNFSWNEIVKDVELRLESNRAFKMVEVENIRTTISHLRIPATEPVITMTSG